MAADLEEIVPHTDGLSDKRAFPYVGKLTLKLVTRGHKSSVAPFSVPIRHGEFGPVEFSVVGETRNITATIYPANATDQAIQWESTDSTVATVDSTGRVTAKAVGFGVFITAYTHDGAHQASVNVAVNP